MPILFVILRIILLLAEIMIIQDWGGTIIYDYSDGLYVLNIVESMGSISHCIVDLKARINYFDDNREAFLVRTSACRIFYLFGSSNFRGRPCRLERNCLKPLSLSICIYSICRVCRRTMYTIRGRSNATIFDAVVVTINAHRPSQPRLAYVNGIDENYLFKQNL